MSMDRDCKHCGNSEWTELFQKDYPKHRKSKNRTVQTTYVCDSCGQEGRHFEGDGMDVFAGALRE